MAKNKIPKISDFQSLGLCDGFAKVYLQFDVNLQNFLTSYPQHIDSQGILAPGQGEAEQH